MSRSWLEALPDDVLRVRPVLSNAYAGSLLVRGEVEGVEERLRDAERWLGATHAAAEGPAAHEGSMIVADMAAFRRLPGSVAVHRAGQALILGDVAGTATHALRVLDLVDDDDHLARGGAAGLLALASWASGELEAASGWYAAAMASLERAGHLSDVIGCGLALADIRLAQGRLGDALRIFERGLALATGQDGPVLRGAADMHVGISTIHCERDDLERARHQLLRSEELGEANGLPQNRYRSRVALARIRLAERDLDSAVTLLTEAERLYVGDFSPDVRPVAALKARVWIAKGMLPEAAEWARERGLAATDELSYTHELEHLTLARLLLAQGAQGRSDRLTRDAADLLERLLRAAEAGHRNGSVIEVLVLLAVARRAQGDAAGALASLSQAMELAEPEGYVRVFVDEGAPVAALLKLAAKQPRTAGYARRLLADAMDTERRPVEQSLVEPLSERELEVLHLLAGDLDGPEIARELTVSLNTLRTHTKSIYAKLGVSSRRAAVRRAAELGLLSRTRDARPTS